jgi:hypothetical protein
LTGSGIVVYNSGTLERSLVMPQFEVAHVYEQGVNLIIVPVSSSFASRGNHEQAEIASDLQLHAREAGLAGMVVVVWDAGGRMGFYAPPNYAPFFRSLSLGDVARNINGTLSW